MISYPGGIVKEKEFKKLISPVVENQTLYQLNQMKIFIDNALKETASKNFSSDQEKIKYLIETLHNIRDFSLALTTENSVRLRIMSEFKMLEEKAKLGNDLGDQKEKRFQNPKEKSEQSLLK